MLKLQTLGSLSLRDEEGNEASAVLSQPKRLALFVYLALGRPRGGHRRDTLLGLFWPERPDSHGRNALSQSLTFLRQNLPEKVISPRGVPEVGLRPEAVSTDVEVFEAAITAGRWSKALDLYVGDFLRGFHVNEVWGFEDWVESERERLREMAAGAAWSLAHEKVDRGALVEAERTAQKALGFVWSDETPLRRFIEALAKAGDRSAALILYEKFCGRLKEELDLGPSAQTEAVAEAIRNGEMGEASPSEDSRLDSMAEGTVHPPGVGLSPPEPVNDAVDPPPGGTREAHHPPGEVTGAPRKRRSLLTLLGVAATVAVALLAYASVNRDHSAGFRSAFVVVPPFENRTGDPAYDETAIMLSEWAGDAIDQVVGVERVPSAFSRQYASEAEASGSKDILMAVADRADAGWVVGGTISDLGDSLELRVSVIHVGRGKEEQSVVEVAPKSAPHESYRLFVGRVAAALAYEFDPVMEELDAGSQPLPAVPTYEAHREHRLGYQAYDRGDGSAAFEHHMAAYALDSTLVRALINAAFMAPDRATKESLAERAVRRQDLLSRAGKLDLANLLASLANDRLGQLNAQRELAALRPNGINSLFHGLFALNLNLPGEALEAILCYDPSLAWRREEAHLYWWWLTRAYHQLGDFEGELTAARRGREQYPNRFNLLRVEVRSLAALGRSEEVTDLLYQALGMPDSPRKLFFETGEEFRAHGHLQESKEVFEMAIDWSGSRPSEEVEDPEHWMYLAEFLYGAERWKEAQEVALPLIHEPPLDLGALGIVGSTAARLGDTALANEIRDHLKTVGRPERVGEHLYQQARISALLGEPALAVKQLQDAFSEGMRYETPVFKEIDFEPLRERDDYQALMRPKG